MGKSNLKKYPLPFVKWAGGKRQLVDEIISIIPFSYDEEFTYIEPFVGGGAVLFEVLKRFKNLKRIIINDLNKDLILTYKIIKAYVADLISILDKFENDYHSLLPDSEERKTYYYLRRDEFNMGKGDDIYRAALFIFLNRTCFNGLYRVNSKGYFNVPIGRYQYPLICDKENLLAVHRALENVEIFNKDFYDILPLVESKSLIYLDPPYRPISNTSSFTSYATGGFDDSDQLRLKEFCDIIDSKGAYWILSNSDPKNINVQDNFFEDLYSGYSIKRVLAKRSINSKAHKRGVLTELLITNFSYAENMSNIK